MLYMNDGKEFLGQGVLGTVEQISTPQEILQTLSRSHSIASLDNSAREKGLKDWADEIGERMHTIKVKEEEKPRISIVIPAKNEENNILGILDTISRQNYDKGVEVIVVANNCTDNTAELSMMAGAKVTEYAIPRKDIPIAKYGKVALARKRGVENARGDIIVFTDADTLVPEEWLSSLTAPLEKDQNISCVTGDVLFFEKSKNPYLYMYDFARRFFRKKDREQAPRGPNIAARRKDILEVDAIDLRVTPSDDAYIGERLSEIGKVLYLQGSSTAVRVSPRRVVASGISESIKQRFPSIHVKSKKYADLTASSD